MPTWTLKADRRKADYHRIVDFLRLLGGSVEGMSLQFFDADAFEMGDDAGNFRDFAAVAKLSHDDEPALEVVAEELILEFGWLIDLARD